jgi:proteasome lid subunit RPN8/RPN11
MPQVLRLSRDQLKSIIAHARAQKPEEACGVLAGDAYGSVNRVFLMENVEHSPNFYMMDSQEQFRVFDEMENEGLELVAIFHSHPHSPAVPSMRDCELAFYPDSLYLIVSLMDDSRPECHAYQINDKQVVEAQIIVSDAP